MQDYNSPRAAVMICTTLVNTQTHTHRDSFRLAILLAQPAHFPTISLISLDKTDRIFTKILSQMSLWTRKSPVNFLSHPVAESGSGVWMRSNRIHGGRGMHSPSALVVVVFVVAAMHPRSCHEHLSVCLSVCQTRELWQNERKVCPNFTPL